MRTHLVFLDEAYKRSALYFHRLACSVVQSDYEVEKIWLSQIARRLFFEVRATNTNTAKQNNKTNKYQLFIYQIYQTESTDM